MSTPADLSSLVGRAANALRMLVEQRAEVREAVELFVDNDMALRGFRRVEDLRELFPEGDVPSVPK
jgi:hypothetical protein